MTETKSPPGLRAIYTLALQLITHPDNWTKGTYARTVDGNRTKWHQEDAAKFCIKGAVLAAARKLGHPQPPDACDLLFTAFRLTTPQHSNQTDIAEWQDQQETTHDEVIAMLTLAHALTPPTIPPPPELPITRRST